jgi:2-C-methyl-D-erythritol 4-phosphate cytidylyltransferase
VNGAILLAAGRSLRMGGRDKTAADLAGVPVAAHALRAFAACPRIDTIVLVAGPANQALLQDLAAKYGGGKVAAVVPGGARRRDSVASGLAALPDAKLVVVHDAARPLVTGGMIERGIVLATTHGAAIASGPITDTIKQVALDARDPARVEYTIDRTRLRAAQTPQSFRRDLLQRAHATTDDDATDDAALVEALGEPVVLYDAGGPNPKITQPEDLAVIEALLRAQPAP